MTDKTGHVHFVGAGPGDPELLTVKAVRLLSEAETVFYDALVGPDILTLIRPGARRVCVGKRAGCASMKQDEINRRLTAEACAGRRVVRLKGGDPSIFGPMDEEIAALGKAGIFHDVCLGIAAVSAAAASARCCFSSVRPWRSARRERRRGRPGQACHIARDGQRVTARFRLFFRRFLLSAPDLA